MDTETETLLRRRLPEIAVDNINALLMDEYRRKHCQAKGSGFRKELYEKYCAHELRLKVIKWTLEGIIVKAEYTSRLPATVESLRYSAVNRAYAMILETRIFACQDFSDNFMAVWY